MKKITQVLLSLIIITNIAGCSSNKASTASTTQDTKAVSSSSISDTSRTLTNVENDSYIIYNLSYLEATQLQGVSSTSIEIKKKDNQTVYTYKDHILSCGTYMNGEIVETIKGNIKTLTGSFNVTHNPYKITKLDLNININMDTNEKTGYISPDGDKLDINSNFVPIG
ncbi:hypothetical protein [Inconstantimicrobium mannanitabidum]|uniref:Uncharacterized protein n=1 Tax=Inconstantimicrobium mannanitabidum TaxID=1604901 RepID=A0ACB5RDX8_9CLOT|nr:hypothetical protein [Clostridium sp. TW13]GKX67473.1 hypothetical protein rsdtw13_27310 [Clostridium sp. TW13]